jgi:hypothetical protein
MNDTEKDAHTARLEAEVMELRAQVQQIKSFLMDPDPSAPSEGSRMTRVMAVVKLVERSNWAAKSLIWVFLTFGSLAGAWLAIRGATK